MAIFTMSDLHLSLGSDKPMEVFGAAWDNYTQRIYENWSSVVGAEDTVLIGGDISWAMHLKDCKADFEFLNSLPGNKLLYKGNHDYWWESMTKMNAFLSDNGYTTLRFMQNNAIVCEDSLVCGTRGWCLPGDGNNSEDDIRIYEREVLRLELSLTDGERLCRESGFRPDKKICILHYPPFTKESEPDAKITDLLQRYEITHCFYGHLHSRSTLTAFEGEHGGIKYRLVSADHLKFCPIKI